jgi:4-hydroxy-tetrahydrodipicolinate synthase
VSDFEAQRAALAEVVAIPVSPFDAKGRLDQDVYRALVRRLLAGGIRAVTPNGNTSEFYSLTPEERRTEAELTVAEAGGEAQIIVGVGHEAPTAIADARRAREAGADMIMVHQPVHPYVSQDGWADYHRNIANAVPELGVVPYLRNPLVEGATLARLGADCPNVIGVKYAVPDAVRFATVARDAGLRRFVWVAGLAELYAPSYFACGATGFTSGLVGVAPGLSVYILR